MNTRENMLIDFITEIANDRYDCVDPAKKEKAQKVLAAFAGLVVKQNTNLYQHKDSQMSPPAPPVTYEVLLVLREEPPFTCTDNEPGPGVDLEQDAADRHTDSIQVKDWITAKTAALTQACEITFTYLTNVNTAEPEQVIEALVAALVLCGRDEAELRECAKAAFDGAAGAF